MSRAGTPARIFIVGVPRSGTTLLQSLLATHTAITSFTESHFFDLHYRFMGFTRMPLLVEDPRPRFRRFLEENGALDAAPVDGLLATPETTRLGRVTLLLGGRDAARGFIETLDRVAESCGAACWLEKTPMNLRFLSLIESVTEVDGTARFVHVIRDGLEVVASLRDASRSWERAYDVAECAARWNDDLERSTARIASANDAFVVYEELTRDPQATLRPLLDWLGLDWEPGILQGYGHTAAELVEERETWKAGVGRAIRTSRTADQRMTQVERDHAQAILRRDLYEQLRDRALGAGASTDTGRS